MKTTFTMKHVNLMVIGLATATIYSVFLGSLDWRDYFVPVALIGLSAGIGLRLIGIENTSISRRLLKMRDIVWYGLVSPFLVLRLLHWG